MTYNICNAPLWSELWCFGFLFDDDRVVIDCSPTKGKLVSTSYKTAEFKTEDGKIDLTRYTTSYRFADTYDEAAKGYNEMITKTRDKFAAIDKDLASRIIR